MYQNIHYHYSMTSGIINDFPYYKMYLKHLPQINIDSD